jgi:predicted small secreted protein
MTTAIIRSLLVVAALALGACGNHAKGGGPDMALTAPPCVQTPVTAVDILNACTQAQTGDPAKDYPYYPSLTPSGTLPPLN